jgi:uncharacterized protein YndB with AHSA1/START domain
MLLNPTLKYAHYVMNKIYVEKTLNAPIELVFEALVDHENYDRFPGVDQSTLMIHGVHTKNGLGARREIRTGFFKLEEDIVAFDAPYLMEYRIMKFFPLKVNHILGRVELESVEQGTRAKWTSEFDVPIPIVGKLIEKQIVSAFSQGFRNILSYIDKHAASHN